MSKETKNNVWKIMYGTSKVATLSREWINWVRFCEQSYSFCQLDSEIMRVFFYFSFIMLASTTLVYYVKVFRTCSMQNSSYVVTTALKFLLDKCSVPSMY